MATVPHGRARRKVEYPTTDGRPMGEALLHGDVFYAALRAAQDEIECLRREIGPVRRRSDRLK